MGGSFTLLVVSGDLEPGNSAAPTETKAQTRSRVLDAAREVFLAIGYRGATLDNIAARAGFTKGAVYWHFPTKQALFLALVAESIAETSLALEKMLNVHGGDPDAMRAAARDFANGLDEREALPIFGVELEIESRTDPSFRNLHQEMIDQHERVLADILGRYFKAIGEPPPMPLDDLATTLTCLFKGFALTRQNRPEMGVSSSSAIRILLGIKS